MEQSDLLRYVVHILEKTGVRYFVTGSTATIFYGDPRFTNDIDIVVDLPESKVSEFCAGFPAADFYVSEPAAREAVATKGQFNIIHGTSGLKVDVIVPELSAFNQSRFARVKRLPTEDAVAVCFASPEDVIIKKMEFHRMGGSDKHLRDITGVLRLSRERIDLDYISKWAKQLNLDDIWAAVQKRISGQ